MKASQLSALLAKTIPAKLPVLITGAPGIGKSDIVEQACKACNAKLIVEHPVVSDPTDYKGLPYASNGKADFLPFGNLQEMIEAKELTVVFLDDLGQAPASVQAACMQLLLARRINGHMVSDNVCFLSATNRRADKAGVSGLLEPVKSRFVTIVNLDVDVDDWIKWALKNNLPTELIAFIKFRPELLHAFTPTNDLVNTPSPRTVHSIAKLMAIGLPKELEFETFTGATGEAFAVEFMGFLKLYRTLPNPDLILLQPLQASVPSDPSVLYALCAALARKASEQTIARLIEYFDRLPEEFNVFAVQASANKNPKIMQTRAMIEWTSKHQEILI